MPSPAPLVRVEKLSGEELFRSVLNSNQLKALDEATPETPNGYSVAKIPVYGSLGGRWHIVILRRDRLPARPPYLGAYLEDPEDCERCFLACFDPEGRKSLNTADPWAAAFAFLCALQSDEEEVNNEAG